MFGRCVGYFLIGLVRLLTGAQARWSGCPPALEQRIYFANHQSHIDLVMIWAALPEDLRRVTRPIAARDYWCQTPFRRWLTTAVFRAIYIERQGPPRAPGEAAGMLPADPADPSLVAADDPLRPLVDALLAGSSVILFPEGTRGSTGEPQAFKSGLYRLAQLFPQVVLVPAWIHNVQRVMPKGEVVPVPILCSVTFGAPVALAPDEARRAFLDRAREAVVALRDR
jgi:1-acyl-sn-glycerol-3-phosphate acyltransferase